MVRRLSEEGLSLRQVARQVSCSHQTAWLVLRSNDGRWARSAWEPGEGRLSVADREEISLGVHRGETFSAIASRLGRATSTVSREVAANGGRDGYRAWRAHERAREQARRPKRPKLACDGDPSVRAEPVTVQVLARHQPVLPEPVPGQPFRRVELEGMAIEAVVNRDKCKAPWDGRQHRCGARVTYKVWARGLRTPAPAGARAGNGKVASG